MSPFVSVVGSVLLWLCASLFVAAIAIVRPNRLYGLWGNVVPRLRDARRELLALGVVLLVSAVGRGSLQTISELFGLRLTGFIWALEGNFVAWLQQEGVFGLDTEQP